MQPPRSRTPRIDLGNTETLRALILNFTAAIITLMLLRFATLLVAGADDATVPRYFRLVSEPLVFPFQQIPYFDRLVFQEVTLADALIIPIIVLTGLLIAGILTGWRESDNGARRYPALRDHV